jgi:hypothetical protein
LHSAFTRVRNWQILSSTLALFIIPLIATRAPRPGFEWIIWTLSTAGHVEVTEPGTRARLKVPLATRCRILVHSDDNTVFETEDGRCGMVISVDLIRDTKENRAFIKKVNQ